MMIAFGGNELQFDTKTIDEFLMDDKNINITGSTPDLDDRTYNSPIPFINPSYKRQLENGSFLYGFPSEQLNFCFKDIKLLCDLGNELDQLSNLVPIHSYRFVIVDKDGGISPYIPKIGLEEARNRGLSDKLIQNLRNLKGDN